MENSYGTRIRFVDARRPGFDHYSDRAVYELHLSDRKVVAGRAEAVAQPSMRGEHTAGGSLGDNCTKSYKILATTMDTARYVRWVGAQSLPKLPPLSSADWASHSPA